MTTFDSAEQALEHVRTIYGFDRDCVLEKIETTMEGFSAPGQEMYRLLRGETEYKFLLKRSNEKACLVKFQFLIQPVESGVRCWMVDATRRIAHPL